MSSLPERVSSVLHGMPHSAILIRIISSIFPIPWSCCIFSALEKTKLPRWMTLLPSTLTRPQHLLQPHPLPGVIPTPLMVNATATLISITDSIHYPSTPLQEEDRSDKSVVTFRVLSALADLTIVFTTTQFNVGTVLLTMLPMKLNAPVFPEA